MFFTWKCVVLCHSQVGSGQNLFHSRKHILRKCPGLVGAVGSGLALSLARSLSHALSLSLWSCGCQGASQAGGAAWALSAPCWLTVLIPSQHLQPHPGHMPLSWAGPATSQSPCGKHSPAWLCPALSCPNWVVGCETGAGCIFLAQQCPARMWLQVPGCSQSCESDRACTVPLAQMVPWPRPQP